MKGLTWLFAFSLLSPAGRVINFDSDQIGKTPPGWTVLSTGKAPEWAVLRDNSAPTQPYVLAEVSTNITAAGNPLAILNEPAARNADVSVRIKPISGRGGVAGGVVWRFRDENNYYVARADARDNTVSVYKVENGRRIPISTVKHPVPFNSWSILKVSARGPRFQIFVDHRRALDGQDKTFSTPGRVGLWALSDSVIYFDDFRVYPK